MISSLNFATRKGVRIPAKIARRLSRSGSKTRIITSSSKVRLIKSLTDLAVQHQIYSIDFTKGLLFSRVNLPLL